MSPVNTCGDQPVETVGPGADFRHDYDYLASYRRRSDRALRRLVEFGERCAGADRNTLKSGVDNYLSALVERLFESPYYRRVLRRRGLSPRDLTSVDDLDNFPTLDRETLGANWRSIPVVDETSPAYRDATLVRSSGSTGAPIEVVRDGYDLVHMWTMVRYWAGLADVALPDSPVVVLLCDLPSGLEYRSRLPTLDDGRLIRISTRQPEPRKRLMDAEPDVLCSDPAGFHWLLGTDPTPSPAVALSSAQHLPESMRATLRRRLCAPVINYYSSSETGPVAWECLKTAGRFHVLLPDMWVESVDGELVVTRLRPSIVPLLRYRMGDAGQVVFDTCRCGYCGWTIEGFDGRRSCLFLRPDADPIDAWKLARLFKRRALDGFRLVQIGVEDFRLKLVDGQDGGEKKGRLRGELMAALGRLGWSHPTVDVEYVETLEVQGPKPRPFCRQIDDERR